MNTVSQTFKVIAPKQKALSNKDHIIALEVDEEINAPYEKRSTIAPLISNIKREFKDRDFETSKLSITTGRKTKHFLNIRRIA